MNNQHDLISREAAIAWFFRPYSNEEYYSNLDVKKALKAIPTVDAAPIVYGQWNEIHTKARGYGKIWYQHDCAPFLYESPYYFCPNCGAKMESKRQHARADECGQAVKWE